MRVPLVIAPGIVSDDTTFSTPGRFSDGNNMRPWRGRMQTIGGWSEALSETLSGTCRNVLPWTDNDGTLTVAFGTHSHLQVLIGGELSDITPTGLPEGAVDGAPGAGYGAGVYDDGTYGTPRDLAGPRTWSLATYGESLIASPAGGTIYQWLNDTGTPAEAVTNAPSRIYKVLITPERQALACGCNEEVSDDFNPLCIRGSDIENITDWTTSGANNAFEHILEGGGRIVGAELVGSYVAVWTDNALHLGQFIGQAGQAYRFDRVEANCGLIGPNAVAVLNGTAYWVAPDLQFRAWSPGNAVQIIPCPIRNDFKDNLDVTQAYKIAATTVAAYGEVWWHYPDSRDGNENSRYVALSTIEEGAPWFRGMMARTAACDAGVLGFPMMVTDAGHVMYHETGRTANGGILNWSITTSDQYIGEADRAMMVRGVWPDFEDQAGSVAMTVNVRMNPQSDQRAKGPYGLAPMQAKKNFRASGRVASVTFAGASAPSFARLGKPQFDVVATGER